MLPVLNKRQFGSIRHSRVLLLPPFCLSFPRHKEDFVPLALAFSNHVQEDNSIRLEAREDSFLKPDHRRNVSSNARILHLQESCE